MYFNQYSFWLHTGWPGFYPRQSQRIFSSSLRVQTSYEAQTASY
jgi:hypothetical protein